MGGWWDAAGITRSKKRKSGGDGGMYAGYSRGGRSRRFSGGKRPGMLCCSLCMYVCMLCPKYCMHPINWLLRSRSSCWGPKLNNSRICSNNPTPPVSPPVVPTWRWPSSRRTKGIRAGYSSTWEVEGWRQVLPQQLIFRRFCTNLSICLWRCSRETSVAESSQTAASSAIRVETENWCCSHLEE